MVVKQILADLLKNHYENKTKKAINSAKRAIASVKAKPIIAYLNKVASKDGLRAIPLIRAANIVPIPTPAPVRPIAARPAPNCLADCSNILKEFCKKQTIPNLNSMFRK